MNHRQYVMSDRRMMSNPSVRKMSSPLLDKTRDGHTITSGVLKKVGHAKLCGSNTHFPNETHLVSHYNSDASGQNTPFNSQLFAPHFSTQNQIEQRLSLQIPKCKAASHPPPPCSKFDIVITTRLDIQRALHMLRLCSPREGVDI